MNFVASFRDTDLVEIPDLQWCGRILNIYESSDPFGVTAVARREQSTCDIQHFREIEIHTGLGHGFLFRPLPEWIEPAARWALGLYDWDE